MTIAYSRFESLGANCEFGFFLRDQGQDDSTLFRWAEVVQLEGLERAIRNAGQGMCEDENLVPWNEGMVLDTAFGIAWHTPVTSEIADPTSPRGHLNMRFTQDADVRAALLTDQRTKLAYLTDKFARGAQDPGRIYVYKARTSEPAAPEAVSGLQEVLREQARGRLLFVAVDPSRSGTVEVRQDGLMLGYVDRFAPGNAADNYSAVAWTALCEAALSAASRQTGWLPTLKRVVGLA